MQLLKLVAVTSQNVVEENINKAGVLYGNIKTAKILK
jgi:hypothetical protein